MPVRFTRAPDGMTISLPPRSAAAPLEPQSKRGQAIVPQRVQVGPTCGLYAMGMVMDYWHGKDARNPSALVSDVDLRGPGKQYTTAPTTQERILEYAKGAGYTSQGEMFDAAQLAEVAAHFGYAASIHDGATLSDLYRVLDRGRPAIVAFDVDMQGDPGDYGGMRAHYAVIEGYFDRGGERYLCAKHGWGVKERHVWRASDFERSWRALRETDYYGTPGDGVIPSEPSLREPAKLSLPDLGRGRAGISASLARKIVEVVPAGDTPTGGRVVSASLHGAAVLFGG